MTNKQNALTVAAVLIILAVTVKLPLDLLLSGAMMVIISALVYFVKAGNVPRDFIYTFWVTTSTRAKVMEVVGNLATYWVLYHFDLHLTLLFSVVLTIVSYVHLYIAHTAHKQSV